MKKTIFWAIIMAMFCFYNIAQAKRAPSPEVKPVIYQGLRFVASGKIGYVEAWDKETNKKVWEKKVYNVIVNPLLESDVQAVFITSLAVSGNKLTVLNENGEKYQVDIPLSVLRGEKYQGNYKQIVIWLVVLAFGAFGVALGYKEFKEIIIKNNRINKFQLGGIYSIISEENIYALTKIIKIESPFAVEAPVIHVKIFKNRFNKRFNEEELKGYIISGVIPLGAKLMEGAQINHLPLSINAFEDMAPQFIFKESVDKIELEGYEIWKKDGGASFNA